MGVDVAGICMKFFNIFNNIQEDINEENDVIKKYPIIPCKKDRSYEGLIGFLIEQDIIQDEFNPLTMVDKAFNRRKI